MLNAKKPPLMYLLLVFGAMLSAYSAKADGTITRVAKADKDTAALVASVEQIVEKTGDFSTYTKIEWLKEKFLYNPNDPTLTPDKIKPYIGTLNARYQNLTDTSYQGWEKAEKWSELFGTVVPGGEGFKPIEFVSKLFSLKAYYAEDEHKQLEENLKKSDMDFGRTQGPQLLENFVLYAKYQARHGNPAPGIALDALLADLPGQPSYKDDLAADAKKNGDFAATLTYQYVTSHTQPNGDFVGKLDELKAQAQANQATVMQTLTESRAFLVDISKKQQVLVDWVNDQKAKAAAAEEAQKVANLHQLKLNAASSSVYLLSTLISLGGDKKLGHDVAVVGNASIQIAEAVNKYLKPAAVVDTAKDLAAGLSSVVLTGNIVGAALEAISIFSQNGPSPDQLILQQLVAISQQITDLRIDLDSRLSKIDSTLSEILSTLDERFNHIDFVLGILYDNVESIESALFDLQASLNRVERDFLSFLQDGFGFELQEGINGYLGYKERTGAQMTYQPEYITAENLFYSWAFSASRNQLWAGPYVRSYADSDLFAELTNLPQPSNWNFLAQYPAQRLGLPALAANRIANPRIWALSADSWRQLGFENAWYATMIAPFRFNDIYGIGKSLQTFTQNVTTVNTASGKYANRELWSRLLQTYQPGPVQTAIQKTEDTYKGQNGIDASVNLWGGVDQILNYVPINLRSGKTLTPYNSDTRSPETLSIPAHLAESLPAPLKLAEAMGLGKLTFKYSLTYPNWTNVRIPEGHNQCQTKFVVYAFWEGNLAVEWDATLSFHAEGEAFGNDDWHIVCDPAYTGFTQDEEWIPVGDWGYWDIHITAPPRLFFDFGSNQALDWWNGNPIEWWQQHATVTLPALRVSIISPNNMGVQAGVINDLRSKVQKALRDAQIGFYQQIVHDLSAATQLNQAAQVLSGQRELLFNYVSVGMARSLESNEFLRSLVGDSGSQRVVDQGVIRDLYNAAISDLQAGNDVPKVDVSTLATKRLTALGTVLNEILDSIEKGGLHESFRLVDSTLASLDVYQATKFVPTITDASRSILLTNGGLRYDRASGLTFEQITCQNISGQAISGPISICVDQLTPNASLYYADGLTESTYPKGSPYINIGVGPDNVLLPGHTSSIVLEFARLDDKPFTFRTHVLAGTGPR